MSNPEPYDRQDWLDGKPPPAAGEEDAFAAHARAGREALEGGEAESLLAELDGRIDATYGPQQGRAVRRRLPRRWLAVAATLLLLCAAALWLWGRSGPSAEALYAESFAPYANELSERTMGEDTPATAGNAQREAALLAYDRGEYGAAAAHFDAYFANGVVELPAERLYYGISLLASGAADRASAVLAELVDDPDYGDPAAWYRALAVLRERGVSPATPHLRAVAQNENSRFRERARTLLQKIE